MKTYKTSTPEFKDSVELIEPTDTNHADNVTAADIQNFQNTLSNRVLLRSLINLCTIQTARVSFPHCQRILITEN